MPNHADPWIVLGINRNASAKDIKAAYRRLAKDHHPDQGGDPDRFIQIQAAYQQLVSTATHSTTPKVSPVDNPLSQFVFESEFAEFFRSHFDPHYDHPNSNFDTQIRISLAESITGCKRTIRIDDHGATKTIDILIPAGAQTGDVVKYSGMGSTFRADLPPGSLYVRILIEPFEDYQVQDGNLCCERTISVWQALLGSQLILKDPFGASIEVQVPASVTSHTVLRIPERGGFCRIRNKRADVLVKLIIKMPQITPEQHQVIRGWVDSEHK